MIATFIFIVAGVPAPAQTLLNPPPAIAAAIDAAARQFGVEPELLYAIAQVESRFNPRAIAPGGYLGLFQLSPVYFKAPPGESLLDPIVNARIAAAFVRGLLDRQHSVEGALRRYSATPATAQKQLALYRLRKALAAATPPPATPTAVPVTAAPVYATPPALLPTPLPLETPPQRPRAR